MITNKIEVWSGKRKEWVDLTKYAVFPLKTGNFLDEKLDEIYLQLTNCPYAVFPPLTQVKITIKVVRKKPWKNSHINDIVYRGNTEIETIRSQVQGDNDIKVTQTMTIHAVVANDSAYKKPINSPKKADGTPKTGKTYAHNLYLIELTKIAEGFISDSITFTNSLGATYTE